MSKESTKKAIENYYKRQEVDIKPTRKNKKPEKQVEQDVLIWAKSKGMSLDIIEAKAKFNTATGMYTGRAASAGLSDLIGNTQHGLAVFIELKSHGRRIGSALHPRQRAFLTEKIMSNCFAICADSSAYCEKVYTHWLSLPTSEERIAFLLKELPEHNPQQLKLDQSPGTLFDAGDDDLPW